jgi:hypothetical protein
LRQARDDVTASFLERFFVRAGKGEPDTAGELLQLARLAYHHAPDLVRTFLASAREQLSMDVAFVSEAAEGR